LGRGWRGPAHESRVGAAGAGLDFADDVIAVSWLLAEQSKDDEAQFTGLEQATAAAAVLGRCI